MKVICAWCEREGRPAGLGERAPLEDPRTTHGICRRHELALLARLPSRSFPATQLLLVVAPRELHLYEHLVETFRTVAGVTVILDRRGNDRRIERGQMSEERRRRERRRRFGESYAMGYTMVRFGQVTTDARRPFSQDSVLIV